MLENLELIGTGFGLVMAVLASLWGATALIGRVFVSRAAAEAARAASAAAAVAAPAAAPSAPAAVGDGRIPPHHLVAITAAVQAVMQRPVRVTHIAAPPHSIRQWPLEGRIESYFSHRVRQSWGPTRPTSGDRASDSQRGNP